MQRGGGKSTVWQVDPWMERRERNVLHSALLRVSEVLP